ncbi:MAG: DtxR family iron (metal) dependent repressor [Desulfobacterales bacterium]|nr:MAG: DtxR family iron (metal) dependent repressor [Desulfobacterales bacterium]
MVNTMTLSENLEDYLEIILALQIRNKVARSKDIASALDIQRASVTGMLKKLAALNLINYEPYGFVTLTPKGETIAKEITSRHTVFRQFLIKYVGLDEDVADDTACRLEHAVDNDTFSKFKKFIDGLDHQLS